MNAQYPPRLRDLFFIDGKASVRDIAELVAAYVGEPLKSSKQNDWNPEKQALHDDYRPGQSYYLKLKDGTEIRISDHDLPSVHQIIQSDIDLRVKASTEFSDEYIEHQTKLLSVRNELNTLTNGIYFQSTDKGGKSGRIGWEGAKEKWPERFDLKRISALEQERKDLLSNEPPTGSKRITRLYPAHRPQDDLTNKRIIDTLNRNRPAASASVEAQLRAAIREELDSPNCKKLRNLCAQLDTQQGRDTAEEYIFTQCATYGIAVQTAMSDYDSSLGE